eukprot:TRINITY_DN423_c0_g1_i2.p1 TRINITY_DN423_c0_g1~~TRINITY_DN423_c0_g1_i2.p1  ORF type:complete len:321 (+),score=48.77 TRINITY_DN423_c0_g1_i2:467-1429(+)
MEPNHEAKSEEMYHRLSSQAVRAFHIVYKGFLANHMTHMLHALFSLGASPKRLEEYYVEGSADTGFGPLEPAKPSQHRVTLSNWDSDDCLGKTELFQDYVDFFEDEITRSSGISNAVALYLPRLLSALPLTALHNFIQLTWGAFEGKSTTIASGLAYFACSYEFLFTPPPLEASPVGGAVEQSASGIVSLLKEIHADDTVTTGPGFDTDGNFTARVKSLVENDTIKSAVFAYAARWPIAASPTLEESLVAADHLVEAATLLFYHGSDARGFFFLHGVTSAHGLFALLPLLKVIGHHRFRQISLSDVGGGWDTSNPLFPLA